VAGPVPVQQPSAAHLSRHDDGRQDQAAGDSEEMCGREPRWQASGPEVAEQLAEAGNDPSAVPAETGASRIEYRPGELAQCGLWFPPVDMPAGFDQVVRPPVLVMMSGYSQVITARMIPSRQREDLLAGQWALLSGWGQVPRALVWDNESAIESWRSGRPQLTEAMQGFPRGTRDQGRAVPTG
jgi:hypothetical protein